MELSCLLSFSTPFRDLAKVHMAKKTLNVSVDVRENFDPGQK